jgi:hypothetical protein
MRVFKQIKDTFAILRNEDVEEHVENTNVVEKVQKWHPLHNNQYMIREEFAPFPLSGLQAIDTKDGFYIYGGVGRFNQYASEKLMFCVRDIDWSNIELKNTWSEPMQSMRYNCI